MGLWVFFQICFAVNNFNFYIFPKTWTWDKIHKRRVVQILCPELLFTWAPLCDLLRVNSTRDLPFMYLFNICIYVWIYCLVTWWFSWATAGLMGLDDQEALLSNLFKGTELHDMDINWSSPLCYIIPFATLSHLPKIRKTY